MYFQALVISFKYSWFLKAGSCVLKATSIVDCWLIFHGHSIDTSILILDHHRIKISVESWLIFANMPFSGNLCNHMSQLTLSRLLIKCQSGQALIELLNECRLSINWDVDRDVNQVLIKGHSRVSIGTRPWMPSKVNMIRFV